MDAAFNPRPLSDISISDRLMEQESNDTYDRKQIKRRHSPKLHYNKQNPSNGSNQMIYLRPRKICHIPYDPTRKQAARGCVNTDIDRLHKTSNPSSSGCLRSMLVSGFSLKNCFSIMRPHQKSTWFLATVLMCLIYGTSSLLADVVIRSPSPQASMNRTNDLLFDYQMGSPANRRLSLSSQQMFVSSSPPPAPYLPLNRVAGNQRSDQQPAGQPLRPPFGAQSGAGIPLSALASQFPGNYQGSNQIGQRVQPFGGANPNQPLNSIQLNNLANFLARGGANSLPTRGPPPRQSQFSQQQPPANPVNSIPLNGGLSNLGAGGRGNPMPQRQWPAPSPMLPSRLPLPPNVTPISLNTIPSPQRVSTPSGSPNLMRPISGFAPSGPPPMLTSNSAINVVQSPAGNAPSQAPPVTTTLSSSSSKTTPSPRPMDEPPKSEPEDEASSASAPPTDDRPQDTSTTQAPTTLKISTDTSDLDKAANEPSGQESSSWAPLDSNRSSLADQQFGERRRINLSPSPDIVTVPPGYNPDNPAASQPQNYDIAVSAQMGGSRLAAPASATNVIRVQPANESEADKSEPVTSSSSSSSSSATFSESPSSSLVPTAVTTIIWSPPSESPTFTVQPTSVLQATEHLKSSPTVSVAQPAQSQPQSHQTIQTLQAQQTSQQQNAENPPAQQVASAASKELQQQQQDTSLPNRIRDNSLLNDQPQQTVAKDNGSHPSKDNGHSADSGVVYGKSRDSKPQPPAHSVGRPPLAAASGAQQSDQPSGRPFILPAPMDNQVRPFTAGAQQHRAGQQEQQLMKSSHQHQGGSSAPFRPSSRLGPNGLSPMHVNSGFSIAANGNQTMPTGDIQDYIAAQPPMLVPAAAEPTISAHGGPDPAGQSADPIQMTANRTAIEPASPSPAPRVRRPTFKPKPAVPPIRIDSCIVDDDSSCDQSHNERCVTEYGISSCHCKPGYARLSQLRGYCSPISLVQLNLKVDKLSDDRRLAFNHTLENPNSEEYQYMEFEAVQALASAFQQTSLAKQFMGARVNKFFERKGKIWVNMSLNFELNNVTKNQDKIQGLAGQELARLIQLRGRAPLGDSTIMLDGNKETVSKLTDVNECANRDLNDCSKFATCTNEFGGFQCQCLPGYEDRHQASEDRNKRGRVCLGCSASYCSNRGECSIVDGQKQCKCRANFVGARCDYDTEVLAVAIGGSLIGFIILVVTCWGLYVFNRRWKREQQKMDAMSATSGLTYNYINSNSTNSLMSPGHAPVGGPGARPMQRAADGTAYHPVAAMASSYGHRLGNALVGGACGHQQHYAPDQQAIIGSTSSGSSASSQQMAALQGPYSAGYHHAHARGAHQQLMHPSQQQQYEDAGLLIAPASTGSSEQNSPSGNSYRTMGNQMLMAAAGNAYTLSGHHHHHQHLHNGHHNKSHPSQFHPAADYRTLGGTIHCGNPPSGAYESRWRNLQQEQSKQQSSLVGYYLSPDMLMGQPAGQIYASPQRELCIDTGISKQHQETMHHHHHNHNHQRRQQGRAANSQGLSLRSRSRGQRVYAGNESHETYQDR